MKKPNNIDKLAQDKLKNHEITAPEMVWTNIERELKKKKEHKLFPIWWKYAGVAAVLLIGFFIGKEFSGGNKNENVVPMSATEVKSSLEENTNENSKNSVLIDKNDEVLVSNKKNKLSQEKSKTTTNNQITINENQVLVSNENNELSNEKKSEKSSSNKRKFNFNETNAVANNSSVSNKNKQNKDVSVSNIIISSSFKNFEEDKMVNNDKIVQNDSNIIVDKKESKNESKTANNFNKLEIENKLFDQKNQLTTTENQFIKKDSIAKKPNVLENLLAAKTKKKTKENKTNKWLITPNIAPIYTNSTSNNSTFDSTFDNNSKSYENNISLGLAVNYAITKKISIRTGINKFDVSNNTINIGFYKNSAISSTVKDATAIISNDYTISNNIANQTLEINQVGTALNPVQNPTKTEGTLNQKTAYLEVPLEISYAILDKKFSINLITGFSTLFLNKNKISIISNNNNIDLGQADNLNRIHYSTNVGLGFNYKFAKSFQVNLEPMMKYQINTFSNDVSNFKPYFIGIYSGISFGF